ncbi:lamin tail domain-containing protein [Flaviaesturariibacter amylovorans]|uniref:LTD domain-containing protein n=1 Tax=Flaviaesturariibacter amylovorans TaxID=1084520 RepID=A0ABP8H8T7_9BACT
MSARILKLVLLSGIVLLFAATSKAQSYGRVVINEYMPWTSNTCGVATEFVELLNFGPGPTNIGCYILTNGKYSVTIPPNTILQPGQYYVISGVNTLVTNCGNIDGPTVVNLNWNTCGCTNTTIPTAAPGFMPDGGNGNPNMVLFDASMNVVDAVTRSTPAPAVSTITTSSVSSQCVRKTFDLDNLTLNYEVLGMSTGQANSFARRLDGDCEWIKQPQISAGANNNKTSGGTSSITYSMNIVNAMDYCTGQRGAVTITASGSNISTFFPMEYTIAYDADGNGVFDFSDTYTYGSDNSSPDIELTGLAGGSYRVTVGSYKGCNLKTFVFSILPCGPLLPIKLLHFGLAGSSPDEHTFNWRLADLEGLETLALESSTDGATFRTEHQVVLTRNSPRNVRQSVARRPGTSYYRLRITGANGRPEYSRVINTGAGLSVQGLRPNPATNRTVLEIQSPGERPVRYRVYGVDGRPLLQGSVRLHAGTNEIPLQVSSLPAGLYQVSVDGNGGDKPMTLRFMKQ